MNTRTATLVVVACAFTATPASAGGTCLLPGTKLKPTESVPIREKPPEERFLFVVSPPGAQLSVTQPDESVTVIKCQLIEGPARQDIWIETRSRGATGWSYAGSSAELKNFKLER